MKNNDSKKNLYEAFLSCNSTDEIANFCRDLMTEDEINEFSKRYQIATMLKSGKSQRYIAKDLNVSITTVTRVNKWLTRGMEGYNTILNKLPHHQKSQSIGL